MAEEGEQIYRAPSAFSLFFLIDWCYELLLGIPEITEKHLRPAAGPDPGAHGIVL